MKNKRSTLYRSIEIILVLILLMCIYPSALAASVDAIINTTTAKVYEYPSEGSASLYASKGITVSVLACSNGWARISYRGKIGYIKSIYLNLKDRIEAYIYGETPAYDGTDSTPVGTLSTGTKVYVVGYYGNYGRVQNKSGSITVYVPASSLVSPPQMAAYTVYISADSTPCQKATALAVGYLGRPYGTNAPSSFNCTSLVRYCFGMFGFDIKGSAAEIGADNSLIKINHYSSLTCGDILCFDFDNNSICDHVGIYITNGNFIEANQSTGQVQINTMSSWYKEHTLWARRV